MTEQTHEERRGEGSANCRRNRHERTSEPQKKAPRVREQGNDRTKNPQQLCAAEAYTDQWRGDFNVFFSKAKKQSSVSTSWRRAS